MLASDLASDHEESSYLGELPYFARGSKLREEATIYGLVVHSHGDFFGSIAFPAVADLALRVNKLGNTSVTYEIGLFERGVEEVKSVGELIHVFVDRETGRPAASGMNANIKEGLKRILVTQSKL
ncbi:hypothetical protein IFR04_007448 [Cadophora malorum]|uniref:Thioesterase domain-containing protein n=1 Tax=Cadophora malorum TaxID=108018 RepID=A0A8H7W8N4_9HELO|nr:hypothetical protein IFR04_007448 [Cadophora malorum]